jgi:hypothetical protein
VTIEKVGWASSMGEKKFVSKYTLGKKLTKCDRATTARKEEKVSA